MRWTSLIPTDANELHNSLKRQHLLLAIVHLLNTIGIIVAVYWNKNQDLFNVTVVMQFFSSNSRATTKPHAVFESTNLAVICILFSFCAFLDHLFCCSVGWPLYSKLVDLRNNYIRWIEYSLSSSLMVLVVSILSGILDFSVLFLLFGCMASTISFGWIIDQVSNDPVLTRRLFWLSQIPYGFMWTVILTHFVFNVSQSSAPWFVYVIIVSIFVLFGLFGYVHERQCSRTGRYAVYEYSETMFNILSLVAKTSLAWILVPGILMASQ